jgi:hypothetical protein
MTRKQRNAVAIATSVVCLAGGGGVAWACTGPGDPGAPGWNGTTTGTTNTTGTTGTTGMTGTTTATTTGTTTTASTAAFRHASRRHHSARRDRHSSRG